MSRRRLGLQFPEDAVTANVVHRGVLKDVIDDPRIVVVGSLSNSFFELCVCETDVEVRFE